MNYKKKEQEIINNLIQSVKEITFEVENFRQLGENILNNADELGIQVTQQNLNKLSDLRCVIDSLEVATEYLDRIRKS